MARVVRRTAHGTKLCSMNESPAKQLIEDLQALMKDGGYSQAAIAEALGVHRSRLTGWFKDGRIPNADHALAIAALLQREKRRAQRQRQKGRAKRKTMTPGKS